MMSRTDLLLKLVAFDSSQAHAVETLHGLEAETMRQVGPERLLDTRRSACIEALKEMDHAGKSSQDR